MKKIILSIILLFAILFFSSCNSKSEHVLTLGMCPWPGYEPIALASKMKFFKKPVKIIRFSSPHEAYKAFKNGAVDLVALTIDELLKLGDSDVTPKIFLVTDISKGADALVAHPSIKSIDDLKGKRIGLESSVLAQYMLKRILDHSKNLKLSDLSLKNVEIVKQKDAYRKALVDACITFEPAKSALIEEGAKVLFDSSMIPNEIMDVLAARSETFKERKSEIKMFVEGWYSAMLYIQKHPKEAYEMMGSFENISAAVFEKSLEGLEFGTRLLNDRMIVQKEIIKPVEKLKTIMLENAFIKENKDNVENLLGVL